MKGRKIFPLLMAALCALGANAQERSVRTAITVGGVSAEGVVGALSALPVISYSGSRTAYVGGFLVVPGSGGGYIDGICPADAATAAGISLRNGQLLISASAGATVRLLAPDGRLLQSRKVQDGRIAFGAAALPPAFILDIEERGAHRSYKFSK